MFCYCYTKKCHLPSLYDAQKMISVLAQAPTSPIKQRNKNTLVFHKKTIN